MKIAIIIAALVGTSFAPLAEAQVKRGRRFERFDNRTDRFERRGAWEQGSRGDFAEDRFDRFEDRIDRRESRRDEAVDFGRRDVIEDRFDRAENVFDRRENRRDRRRH